MNTIALNAESRLILMDEIGYENLSKIKHRVFILFIAKYMPASFFYLALVCSAVLIYRSIGPWVQNQILIDHLSKSVFATFSSISPFLNISLLSFFLSQSLKGGFIVKSLWQAFKA